MCQGCSLSRFTDVLWFMRRLPRRFWWPFLARGIDHRGQGFHHHETNTNNKEGGLGMIDSFALSNQSYQQQQLWVYQRIFQYQKTLQIEIVGNHQDGNLPCKFACWRCMPENFFPCARSNVFNHITGQSPNIWSSWDLRSTALSCR